VVIFLLSLRASWVTGASPAESVGQRAASQRYPSARFG
jgi:hypothetical protein